MIWIGTRRVVGSAVALAAAAVSIGCADLSWLGGDDSGAGSVTVTTVRSDMTFSMPAKGYLEAMKASPLAVPKVPTGALQVKKIVPEGSIVKAGDTVLVFDDTRLNIDLDNHRASFRSSTRKIDRNTTEASIASGTLNVMKEVAELQRDHVEAFKILDESIYSKLEILEDAVKKDEAEGTILYADLGLKLRGEYYDIEEKILDVEKDQVEGNIDRVKTSLGSLILKAPIGGLIVYKKNWRGAVVSVGDTLWPGNVVMSIVDPSSMALHAFVQERDAAGVKPGSPAVVRIDARPERTFQGSVLSVAEISRPIERDSPVKYTEVKIALPDIDTDTLKPGMQGEASIEVGRVESAVLIPRMLLHGEGSDAFVLVATPRGPRRRPVTPGPGDQVRVSILKGLDEGERVLLGAVSSLAPARQDALSDAGGPGAGL
ncbi:MAG: efflux RND transporter periplasmic adaptor subunit [Acidobacteriota bacterium]